jgi:hypothetical protein
MHTTPTTAALDCKGPASLGVASRGRTAAEPALNFELVKVIDRSMLLNPVQMRRPYRTSSGRPLERGIYAVVWPADRPVHRYDADARFYGPFRAWREASAFVRDSVGARS